MKSFSIGFFLLLITSTLCGQIVDQVVTSFDGERVTVAYNLKSKKADERFHVLVYGSHDNYNQQLVVAGDAGEQVAPGDGKQIVWEAKRDLPPNFNADVQIKIKVIPAYEVSVLAFQPLALTSYKKGRSISITWTGGKPSDKLMLELYQDHKRNQVIEGTLDNKGNYDWKIPKNLKGKNYSFRLVNVVNADQQAESNTFKIKSKTPAIAIIAPVLVVGAGAAFLVLGGEIGD
jgi:hypothetical protein